MRAALSISIQKIIGYLKRFLWWYRVLGFIYRDTAVQKGLKKSVRGDSITRSPQMSRRSEKQLGTCPFSLKF